MAMPAPPDRKPHKTCDHPEGRDPGPAAVTVKPGRGQRAGGPAQKVAHHIGGIETVTGVRVDAIDHVEIGDVDQLHSDIQYQHADDDRHQGMFGPKQRQPAQQQQDKPRRGGQPRPPAIHLTAGPGGDQGPRRAQKPQKADGGVTEMPGRRRK